MIMKGYSKKISETKYYLENNIKINPTVGLILGSGLGVLADEIEDAIIIDFKDIPNFPISTVKGMRGSWLSES